MRCVYPGVGLCLLAGIILVIFLSFMWLWTVVLVAVLAVMVSIFVRGRR